MWLPRDTRHVRHQGTLTPMPMTEVVIKDWRDGTVNMGPGGATRSVIPRCGDFITNNGTKYYVTEVIHDYDENKIILYVDAVRG